MAAATFWPATPLKLQHSSQLDVFSVLNAVIHTGQAHYGINGRTPPEKPSLRAICPFLEITGLKTAVLHLDDCHNPAEVAGRVKMK